MNVSLTPELEQYIAGKVATGMYQTASEVVREALRSLREKEEHEAKINALRADLDAGLNQLDAGQGKPGSAKKTLADLRSKRGR
jgi:antitoxin ParD1/3/4